jgi:hypothetical protein
MRCSLILVLLPFTICAANGDGETPIPGGDVLRPRGNGTSGILLGVDAGVVYARYSGTHAYRHAAEWEYAELWNSFEGGSGLGFAIDAVIDVPLSERFGLIGRLGYQQRKDSYEGSFVNPMFAIDLNTGFPLAATLDGRVRQSFTALTAALLLRWQLQPKGWYLLGGLAAGSYSNSGGDFTQSIVAPANLTYLNALLQPTTSRNVTIDPYTISDFRSTRWSFVVGIGTQVPLSERLSFVPELRADFPLQSFREAPGEALLAIPKSETRFLTVSLSAGLRFAI